MGPSAPSRKQAPWEQGPGNMFAFRRHCPPCVHFPGLGGSGGGGQSPALDLASLVFLVKTPHKGIPVPLQ